MRDSNPRHPAPKAGALPDCANPRCLSISINLSKETDSRPSFRELRMILRTIGLVNEKAINCLALFSSHWPREMRKCRIA